MFICAMQGCNLLLGLSIGLLVPGLICLPVLAGPCLPVLITVLTCSGYLADLSWLPCWPVLVPCWPVLVTLLTCSDYLAHLSWLPCSPVLIALLTSPGYLSHLSWLPFTFSSVTLLTCLCMSIDTFEPTLC